jgi:hypothetical protein
MTRAEFEPSSESRDRAQVHAGSGEHSARTRSAVLDGGAATAPTARSLDVSELEPLTQLVVETRNTRYTLTVLNPADRKVIIQGGSYFSSPTEVSIDAWSAGGQVSTLGRIELGKPISMLTEFGRITTTRLQSIDIFDHEGRPRPWPARGEDRD